MGNSPFTENCTKYKNNLFEGSEGSNNTVKDYRAEI